MPRVLSRNSEADWWPVEHSLVSPDERGTSIDPLLESGVLDDRAEATAFGKQEKKRETRRVDVCRRGAQGSLAAPCQSAAPLVIQFAALRRTVCLVISRVA
eukprot:Selendium_serpulae@DN5933_c1_g1_i3.p1